MMSLQFQHQLQAELTGAYSSWLNSDVFKILLYFLPQRKGKISRLKDIHHAVTRAEKTTTEKKTMLTFLFCKNKYLVIKSDALGVF